MNTITVSSWGTGQLAITRSGAGRPLHKYASKSDPAHAAAEALAMASGLSEYVIAAPKDVLAYIPERLRVKG